MRWLETTLDGLYSLDLDAGRLLTFCPTSRRDELPSVTGLSSAAAASLMSSFSTATSFSTSLPTTCGRSGGEALNGWVQACTLLYIFASSSQGLD